MTQVFFVGGRVYDDVVQVDEDEEAKEGSENVVHEAHEGGWGITVSLFHDLGVVHAEWCLGGGLVFVSWVDSYLRKSVPEVDDGSVWSGCDLMEDGGLVRNGCTVLICVVVPFAEVHNKSDLGGVMLWDAKHGGGLL